MPLLPIKMSTAKETNWAILREWLDERLAMGDSPRMVDLHKKSNELFGYNSLSLGFIKKKLKDHPVFSVNEHQQSKRKARSTRPIIVTNLGNLHIDLMFLHKRGEFQTPKTFRAGTLVGVDVLSRYIYLVPLRLKKSARSLVSAMRELIEKHKKAHQHRIVSVSSDKEPGVMSREFQDLLDAHSIAFHAFSFSSSKAKMAEGAIKRIRKTKQRILLARRRDPKRAEGKSKNWWQILGEIEKTLNQRQLVIDGHMFNYAPADLNDSNLQDFLKQLYKKVSSYYYCQFELNPKLVNFKFKVQDTVRAKLAGITSSLIGNKRSERSVTKSAFLVLKQIAYVTKNHTIGKAYKLKLLPHGGEHIIDEKLLTKGPRVQADDSDYSDASAELDANLPEYTEEDKQFIVKKKLRSGKL